MAATLTILIVDDHTLFVDAMKHVLVKLQDEVEVITATNAEQALQIAEQREDLNLLLLDLNLPGMSGQEALSMLIEKFPLLPVVMLSGTDEVAMMQAAIDAGAMGFIPKSTSEKVVLSALHLVLSGGVYVPKEMVDKSRVSKPVEQESTSDEFAQRLGLTPRQFDVLQFMLGGHANKVIARQLNLTEATVKAHVTAIMKTLKVQKRTQIPMAIEKAGINISSLAK